MIGKELLLEDEYGDKLSVEFMGSYLSFYCTDDIDGEAACVELNQSQVKELMEFIEKINEGGWE